MATATSLWAASLLRLPGSESLPSASAGGARVCNTPTTKATLRAGSPLLVREDGIPVPTKQVDNNTSYCNPISNVDLFIFSPNF